MLNKTAVRNFINGRMYRCNSDIFPTIEKFMEGVLINACDFAKEDRRKYLTAIDIERAIRHQVKKGSG